MKEMLNQTAIIEKLRQKEISLFTASDFKKIFPDKERKYSL